MTVELLGLDKESALNRKVQNVSNFRPKKAVENEDEEEEPAVYEGSDLTTYIHFHFFHTYIHVDIYTLIKIHTNLFAHSCIRTNIYICTYMNTHPILAQRRWYG